jgi:hypothetical protein
MLLHETTGYYDKASLALFAHEQYTDRSYNQKGCSYRKDHTLNQFELSKVRIPVDPLAHDLAQDFDKLMLLYCCLYAR